MTATEPRLTAYFPHYPTPKQAAFLLLPHREAFYGGAAGGGKSDALLMAALQYVDVPGYAALIVRRKFTELSKPEALMDRAHEWLGSSDAHWSQETKTWRFPSGATLTFGHMEYENDKYDYQSSAFQSIGFDELTEFSLTQYLYLFSRLRRLEGFPVPLRMRAASNPGGLGHEWVKQRFIVEGREKRRPFIPAKLGDNPFLDQASYIESLSQLDPVTRAQLLNGDWSARQGGSKFRREWFEIVDAAPAELSNCVRYWDLASTEAKAGKDPDWTAGVKLARTIQGFYYVLNVQRDRARPGAIEFLIRQTAELDGNAVSIYIEEEPGASGKALIDHYQRTVLSGFAARGIRTTGSKEIRANPVSSQAEAGNIKLVRGTWINDFLEEIEAFPNGSHDDMVDALCGAFERLQRDGTPRLRYI